MDSKEDLLERYEELEQELERYRNILENIKEGYFEVDLNGNFLYVNDGFCNIIQYSREELLHLNYGDFTDEENKKSIFQEFNKVYKSKTDKATVLVVFKNRFNKTVMIETSVYLRYSKSKEIIGFNGLARDVTQLKRAEKRLKKSEQKYKDAFNRANLFKDIIIHDINNILQIIQSSAEICQMSPDSNDKKEMIQIIVKNVKRGIKLVQNAGKLSQIEDSEITLKKININKVLHNSLDHLNEKYQEREIYVKLDIPKEIIYVKANELLADIFDNVLINAVQYCEKKVLTIFIKISRDQDNNFIKIEFKDNGIGIQDNRKEIVFETFNKNKDSKGLGFGLSLVKKIIQTYKGKIWIEDRIEGDYSQGSNFVLLIPEIPE
ncbi:MAG: ATP-binding protein [Promethearchaeota archaeon]